MKICLPLAIVFVSLLAFAEPADEQPRIFVVLSGGGARGAAHIGVLKALEEQQVPIHGIVGTSMGAVIGGLYASGYSPAELEELVASVDWTNLFIDEPDRRHFSIRHKLREKSFPITAPAGFDGSELKLPRGAIQGHKLRAFFVNQTLHVAAVRQFDHLSIPFTAVAADIGTGKAVVLTQGKLVDAMFASLAIPAIIEPVELDGKLLVDGGVANNLPVDIAFEQGADIVIAIDVSSPLKPGNELTSLLDVTDQLTSILTRNNTEINIAALRDKDILLLPELGSITSFDFDQAAIAIPAGYEVTMQASGQLEKFAWPDDAFLQYQQNIRRHHPNTVLVQKITIDGDSFAHTRLNLEPGNIATKEMQVAADRVYGLNRYSKVFYDLEGEVLQFRPFKRSWGPNYAAFGIEIEDNFEGRNNYNLGASFIATELPGGADWQLNLGVGEDPRLTTEYFQPIGRGWFANPFVGLESFSLGIFDDNAHLLADYQFRHGNIGVDFGREVRANTEFRFGLTRAWGSGKRTSGDPQFMNLDADRGFFSAQISYDSLDNFYFPKQGRTVDFGAKLSRTGLGADEKYSFWQVRGSQAISQGDHTLFLSIEAESVYEGHAPLNEQSRLGGFFNLSGLQADQLTGQHLGLAKAAYFYRWSDSDLFPAFVGASIEAGNIWQEKSAIQFDDLKFSTSVFLGFDTGLGPLYLAGGISETGNKAIYVFLGRPF